MLSKYILILKTKIMKLFLKQLSNNHSLDENKIESLAEKVLIKSLYQNQDKPFSDKIIKAMEIYGEMCANSALEKLSLLEKDEILSILFSSNETKLDLLKTKFSFGVKEKKEDISFTETKIEAEIDVESDIELVDENLLLNFESKKNDVLLNKNGYKALRLKNGHEANKKIFVERALEVHGEKYDYSLFKYDNSRTKIKIICPEHGVFTQNINDHLYGRGCKSCSSKSPSFKNLRSISNPQDRFLFKFQSIYKDKFDVSLVEYHTDKHKVRLICPEHGEFTRRPVDLFSGWNCPHCERVDYETIQKIKFNMDELELIDDKNTEIVNETIETIESIDENEFKEEFREEFMSFLEWLNSTNKH